MPNVGSIFAVPEDQGTVRYFWCVGTDATQLNSAIIVVFQTSHKASLHIDPSEIISYSVAFYCHTFLSIGKRYGFWRKVGFHRVNRRFDMLFRNSKDYGNPSVPVSKRWYIWKPNEPFQYVGDLTAEHATAEIGVVIPADSVVHRIQTGHYGIVYPTYSAAHEPYA